MARRDDDRAEWRIGTELVPGLRLSRLLAVGDLGAVYAAESRARGKVAVKVLHPELGRDNEQELLRLLRVAEEVGHPRVITPLEILTRPDAPAVVTRYVPGESLAALVERRRARIPPSEALRIACDTLELVGTAHAHYVRHGALSLSHVLLDDHGVSHLLGFGEARLRGQLGLVPDRAFAAPGHDPREPSVAGDLWAVSALLFTLLTGALPRRGRDGEVRSLGEVTEHAPARLVELTDRALAADEGRRFEDAGTLLAAMRLVLQSRDIQYAHSLGSALAAESGSHAWLDPARVTQPPEVDPSWSSTPPAATPRLTPSSRPSSLPPETPRSRLAPTDPPVATPAPVRVSGPPPVVAPRGTTPPSGVESVRVERPRPVLPPEDDPLGGVPEDSPLRAERSKMVAVAGFDSGLSLEDAWKRERGRARDGGEAFARALEDLDQKLGRADDCLRDLAVELSALAKPDPERLVHVAASSFEGPALGPALEAFGPALRAHVSASLEHEPQATLHLLLTLHDAVRAPKAILANERRRVLTAIATPGVIRSVYSRLGAHVSDTRPLEALTRLLPSLGAGFAAELASALPLVSDLTLQAQLVHHLESELTGHEPALGELAKTADARLGVEIVRILAHIDTLAARHALAMAAENPHPVVRIEALGHGGSASGESLRAELKQRVEDAPGAERIQTLRALADHEVRVAAPFLALRLKSPQLDSLTFEERRALFHALSVLSPSRSETLSIEMLGQKKLISTGAHEETRALAASTLGEIGSSDEAVTALTHHAERHIGTSDRVRRAAAEALVALHARRASPEKPPERRRSALPADGRRK